MNDIVNTKITMLFHTIVIFSSFLLIFDMLTPILLYKGFLFYHISYSTSLYPFTKLYA